MLKNKNICVIGGAGFIGSHIVDELAKGDNNVLVLDNLVSGSLENINPKAEFRRFDITSKWQKLAEMLDKTMIDYVFHLAAEPYIPDCYDCPERFFEVNANGTLNVLLACQDAGIERILYFSTSEVYGTVEGKISEKMPTNPHSTYAVSKLAGDRLCFSLFKEHKIPVIILRQFNCYGPRETHDYVIPAIISQLSKSNRLFLGNLRAKRDFTYAGDAAKIAVRLMDKGKVGEVYNSGSGEYYSIKYLANLIGKFMGVIPEIVIDRKKLRPFDVEKLWCDNSKIYGAINSRPKTSLEDGLKETINWFYNNGRKWGWE